MGRKQSWALWVFPVRFLLSNFIRLTPTPSDLEWTFLNQLELSHAQIHVELIMESVLFQYSLDFRVELGKKFGWWERRGESIASLPEKSRLWFKQDQQANSNFQPRNGGWVWISCIRYLCALGIHKIRGHLMGDVRFFEFPRCVKSLCRLWWSNCGF